MIRRCIAWAVTITVMLAGFVTTAEPAWAGFVTTAEPAWAAFTTAQAGLMTVGGGQDGSKTYSQAYGDTFTSSSVTHGADISWSRAGESGTWDLRIVAANLGMPVAGTYESAAGGSKADSLHPQLHLSGPGICADGTGRFVVNQIELTGQKLIGKLDLFFEYQCSATIFGRIVIDLPLPQTAAAGSPSVLLSASAATDPALVRVFADAPAGVAAITAKVYSQTGLQVAATNKFVRQLGTENLGAWVGTQQLLLGAPGFYRIDTEITDRNGITVTQSSVGRLAYAIRTAISNPVANPTFVTATRRTTTLTGVLTSRQPGSGQERPVAGAAVSAISAGYLCACPKQRDAKVVGTGVTAPDGSFAINVSIDSTDFVRAAYNGDPAAFVVGSESGGAEVRLDRQPARITGPSAVWGAGATIAGTATYRSGTAYVPLPGTPVELLACDAGGACAQQATTTTDDLGRYSLTYPGGATQAGLKVVAHPTDPFIADAEWQMLYAAYHSGVAFDWFFGSWLSESTVHLVGGVHFPGTPATKLPIALETKVGSGWERVATTEVVQHPDGWWFFQVLWTVPCGNSLWRATYGQADEVVSTTVQAQRGCPPRLKPDFGGDGAGNHLPQR